jgi:hypothetical protein
MKIFISYSTADEKIVRGLENISNHCLSPEIEFSDMWFMTYVSYPTREIQND